VGDAGDEGGGVSRPATATDPLMQSRRKGTWRTRLRAAETVALNVVLFALAAAALTPFAWLICATLKRGEDLFRYTFLPWDDLGRLSLGNFRTLFEQQPFLRWVLNSVFLASTSTVIVVTLSSLGGFALAKYRFRGRGVLMGLMLGTMMLPGVVMLPSSYLLIYAIGWMNSYLAIIVPGAVSVFGMFLFMQAMRGVPDELLQAGRIDGCSELRLWWEVALPIVRPMTGAFTLLTFLGTWNAFLWPQVVLQSESKYTLPIGLANMMALPEYRTEYGVLMAGTLLAVVPVMILFVALQRDFVSGLSSGAVKG
jgi:ABC-type glycerol-3-phosphate transport system permease component